LQDLQHLQAGHVVENPTEQEQDLFVKLQNTSRGVKTQSEQIPQLDESRPPSKTVRSKKREELCRKAKEGRDDEALAALGKARTNEKTAKTTEASAKAYEKWCENRKSKLAPWPLTVDKMNLFTGYLLLPAENRYKKPLAELEAAKAKNSNLGHAWVDPKGDFAKNKRALERDGVADDQSIPISLEGFRKLQPFIVSFKDLDVVLALLGAWFLCTRPDSFLSIKKESIKFAKDAKGVERATLKVTAAKGKSSFSHEPELEDLSCLKIKPLYFPNYIGKQKTVPVCPVAVFRALLKNALGATLSNFGSGQPGYQRWRNAFIHLFEQAGLPTDLKDGQEERYTLYCTRVGGVCTLLRAGLTTNVVSTLAMWESDQVKRYGKRVTLQPTCVQPVKFYNPRSFEDVYGNASEERQTKKRKLK
jgi:hypothetical protein